VDTFSSPRREAAWSIILRRSFVSFKPSDAMRAVTLVIPTTSTSTLVAVLSLSTTMRVA